MASLIGHGLLSRFPTLRILPVENGSGWVRPLVEALRTVLRQASRASTTRTRVAVLRRNIWIHPFHEEDPAG